MKKTLIAMLALASVASAALTLDAQFNGMTATNNASSYVHDWTGTVTSGAVTLILSKDAMAALDGNTASWNKVFATFNLTGGSRTVQETVDETPTDVQKDVSRLSLECTQYSSNAIRFTTTAMGGSFVKDPQWTVFGTNHYVGKTAWDNATCAAITIAMNSNGNNRVLISTIDANGTITDVEKATITTGVSYTSLDNVVLSPYGITTDAYVYSGAWDNNAVAEITTAALRAHNIPEPATATLSMLALAGLAARRRRH